MIYLLIDWIAHNGVLPLRCGVALPLAMVVEATLSGRFSLQCLALVRPDIIEPLANVHVDKLFRVG